MSILLKRDTKVFIEAAMSGGTVIWEIPVLDGFSFSQGNSTTEVALNEMESSTGVSRRGRKLFNDSLDPAEWSISTYIRPFISAGNGGTGDADSAAEHHAVEEILWAKFVGQGTPGGTGGTWDYNIGGAEFVHGGSNLAINSDASNVSSFGTFNMYFVIGATSDTDGTYNPAAGLEIIKLTDCTVNEATINFDVDGIAQIDWSGNANTLTVETDPLVVSTAITEGVTATNNYIRNKLTSLTCNRGSFTGNAAFETQYDFTLTGGSITFSNNITYLTPQTLGEVNTPIGHITGNRNISGNFSCYITSTSASTFTSGDFLQDALAATSVINNVFALTFTIGGSNAPKLAISLPQCHIEIPTVSAEDIISVEMNFHALPTTLVEDDEFDLTYTGIALPT